MSKPLAIKFFDTYQQKLVKLDSNNHPTPEIKIYTCGPTVYHYQQIGNMYSVLLASTLVDGLKFLGWQVNWVLNITDVGHLVGDGDNINVVAGQDKMEKASQRDGLKPEEVASYYLQHYQAQASLLNIDLPTGKNNPRATDYIAESAKLALEIWLRGYAYINQYGIYFDSSKMSDLELPDHPVFKPSKDSLQSTFTDREIAGITKNPEDFALWRFVEPNNLQKWKLEEVVEVSEKRGLWSKVLKNSSHNPQEIKFLNQWGAPGWHAECVGMIAKVFAKLASDQEYQTCSSPVIDIHTGGEDHISVHHKNEIIQSKAAGFELSKHWLHNKFVLVDGTKMGKSLGNAYLLCPAEKNPEMPSLIENKFDPLSFRLFCLEHHYQNQINFTWPKLQQSQNRLYNLRKQVAAIFGFAKVKSIRPASEPAAQSLKIYQDILADNLNTPLLLDKFQNLVQENLDFLNSKQDLNPQNLSLIKALEENFLKLDLIPKLDPKVNDMLDLRSKYKKQKNYSQADIIRDQLKDINWFVDDYQWGSVVWCKPF